MCKNANKTTQRILFTVQFTVAMLPLGLVFLLTVKFFGKVLKEKNIKLKVGK